MMHDIKRGALRWLWLSIVIILLDHWTKYWAMMHLGLLQPHHVMPFFNFTLDFNRGAAFSFLSFASGWQRWFFAVFAVVIVIGLLVWLARIPSKKHWLAAALALIIGGALGNLWDRVTLGYVVDFIDLYVKHWHWPIFNLADSAISVGVVMLAIDLFFSRSTL